MTPTLRERLEGAIGAQPDGLGSYFVEDPNLTTKEKLDALEQLVKEERGEAYMLALKTTMPTNPKLQEIWSGLMDGQEIKPK